MKTKDIMKTGFIGNEVFVRFMSKCGYSTVPTMQDGIQVWTLEKHKGCKGKSFVYLSFIHEDDVIRLTYPHPLDSKEIRQWFDFDANAFMFAYAESRKCNQTADDGYFMKFEDIFFNLKYTKANKYVRFIFKVFAINPTIIRKCVRQNKNLKRKIDLEVKNRQYFEFLGLERKILYRDTEKALKRAENGVKIDYEAERIAKLNMRAAIKNGAINHDYNYFKWYLSGYIDYQRSHHIYKHVGKRTENRLLNAFIKKVLDYQRENNL